jgi:hypothetical protein
MVDTVVPGVSRGRGKSEQLECEGKGENGVKDLPTSTHVRDKPAFHVRRRRLARRAHRAVAQ